MFLELRPTVPTLAVLRRALARALGAPAPFTAASGSTTTLVCVAPFRSTELPDNALANAWIYCPSITAPKQRRVKAAGLAGGSGTITVDDPFGAAVGNGTVFEVHPRLPAIGESSALHAEATLPGLHDCLNMALRHLLVQDDSQTIALVDGQRDYNVGLLGAFLDRPERLLDVRVLDASGDGYVSTWHTFEFRESGAGNSIHFDQPFRFKSGGWSMIPVILRPADTLITGATSTVGLVAEDDTSVPDVNATITGALAFAYRALRDNRTGADRARYHALYEQQVRLFRRVHNYDTSNDMDPSVGGEDDATRTAAAVAKAGS